MDENELEKRLIEAAVKAKTAAMTFAPPRDYIDMGKKLGVSSTFGMELREAAAKAYNEWKEKNYGRRSDRNDESSS